MDSAVSYARASQDRTGEELSVTRQHEDHRGLAAERGVPIVAELTDNDISAAGKRRRPDFERALQMVKAGEANIIIATDMSRLTRGKAQDEARLLELGVETGLRLWFKRAPDLDLRTAAGRLTASILIAAARHEIEQKSERQKRAAIQAAEQGRPIGGRRPFGYRADGIHLVRTEAAAVRWAYLALLAGLSLGGIARRWNDRGLLTPQAAYSHGCDGACAPIVRPRQCPERRADQDSLWEAQTVRPLLMNPRYAGFRAHVTDEIRKAHPTDPRAARIAGIVGPAVWPAIVDESTWRAALEILANPSRANLPRSGTALLTGVALCGVCGATVHGGASPARRGKPGYRTYRCSKAFGHLGRAAEPVEWFLAEIAIARLRRPDAVHLLERKRSGPDVAALQARLLGLRTRRRNVLALVEDGTYTAVEARSAKQRLDEQIAAAETELTDNGRVNVLGELVRSADVSATWTRIGTDRQRAVLAVLFTRIRLLPPGRGLRLGQTPEAWLTNWDRIEDSVDLVWRDGYPAV